MNALFKPDYLTFDTEMRKNLLSYIHSALQKEGGRISMGITKFEQKSIILIPSIVAICLIYFILSAQNKKGVGEFLGETAELIEQMKVDPDLIYKLSGAADIAIPIDLTDVYANYFAQAAAELNQINKTSGATIAINEVYGNFDIHVYILGAESRQWLADLGLTCNALADVRRQVIIIDMRILSALATGQTCTDDFLPMDSWTSDPTSKLRFIVEATGAVGEEALSQDPSLIFERVDTFTIQSDYWARQIVPLLVIGHELGHLFLHADREMADIDHASSNFNESKFFDLEHEADRFAVDLLIRSMASIPSPNIEEMLGGPTILHLLITFLSPEVSIKAHRFAASTFVEDPKYLGQDRMLFTLNNEPPAGDGARSAKLTYSGSLVEAEWRCSRDIALAHRMLNMAARLQYYLWILHSSNPDLFTASAHVEYDDYYETIREKLEEVLDDCHAYERIWR